MVYGATPATAQAIPLLLVSPPPYAFLPKAMGNDKGVKATTEIERGKARTFPQITIPTRLLQPYTTSPLHQLLQTGGTIMN